jgi:two-component system sporulation sensor kinase A
MRNSLENELEHILDRMTDGFFALDSDWKFTYVNKEASRLLFRDETGLVGKSIWDEFPEAVNTTFYEEYEKAMRKQEPTEFDEFYQPLQTWFDVRVYPSANGLTVFFLDITEKNRT